MLRITVLDNSGLLTFRLEGRLAGPWVRELENCWQSTQISQCKPVLRFDLTGVTFVDSAGKAFLAARHAQGAELIASGCLMRAVVAEITTAPISECGGPESDRELPGLAAAEQPLDASPAHGATVGDPLLKQNGCNSAWCDRAQTSVVVRRRHRGRRSRPSSSHRLG